MKLKWRDVAFNKKVMFCTHSRGDILNYCKLYNFKPNLSQLRASFKNVLDDLILKMTWRWLTTLSEAKIELNSNQRWLQKSSIP